MWPAADKLGAVNIGKGNNELIVYIYKEIKN